MISNAEINAESIAKPNTETNAEINAKPNAETNAETNAAKKPLPNHNPKLEFNYVEHLSDELQEICKTINYPCSTESQLFELLIDRDVLLSVDIEEKLTQLVAKLKSKYKTDGLNCLHKNRNKKQKFPGINLIRQIFKCNGYHLKPFFYSAGYNKANGQKIVKRNFKVVRLTEHDCYSYGYVVGYNVSHNTKMHNAVGILKTKDIENTKDITLN